ncbi:MAG TPA: hypothetical protein DDZ68_14495 [Parvularcula sp.]|nr:hypothetical protein [Parvularcula sp.]HBS34622.1 hypothetical protein [Parvularcula sp.]
MDTVSSRPKEGAPMGSIESRRRAAAAARRFGAVAAGLLSAAAIAVVALARFDFLGAGVHVNLAMLLGALGTIGVGVGLMALTFYSSRSGADDEVKMGSPDDPAP